MTMGVARAFTHALDEHAALTLPQAPTAPEKSREAVTGHVAAGGGGDEAVGGGGDSAAGGDAAPQLPRAMRTAPGTPAATICPA